MMDHYALYNRLCTCAQYWCLLELNTLIPASYQIFEPSFRLIKTTNKTQMKTFNNNAINVYII